MLPDIMDMLGPLSVKNKEFQFECWCHFISFTLSTVHGSPADALSGDSSSDPSPEVVAPCASLMVRDPLLLTKKGSQKFNVICDFNVCSPHLCGVLLLGDGASRATALYSLFTCVYDIWGGGGGGWGKG